MMGQRAQHTSAKMHGTHSARPLMMSVAGVRMARRNKLHSWLSSQLLAPGKLSSLWKLLCQGSVLVRSSSLTTPASSPPLICCRAAGQENYSRSQ
jgi:hypothetical protein